jgi:hypothetical protein
MRDWHWTILGIALFVVVASCTLSIDDSGKITLSGLDVELPPLCGSRALFNLECPGCGLTRSFIALAAGDLWQSFEYHRLGWLLALAIAAQFPYRIFSLRELRQDNIVDRTWPTWFGYFVVATIGMNWLFKMIGL